MILVGSSPTSISEAPTSNPPAPFFAVRNCGGMAMAEGCPGSKPAKLQGKGRVRRKMASTSCHGRSVFFFNKGYREKKLRTLEYLEGFRWVSKCISPWLGMISDSFTVKIIIALGMKPSPKVVERSKRWYHQLLRLSSIQQHMWDQKWRIFSTKNSDFSNHQSIYRYIHLLNHG